MKHYLLQATHKRVSHKLRANGSNLVEYTEFATFLHYCVNSEEKKIGRVLQAQEGTCVKKVSWGNLFFCFLLGIGTSLPGGPVKATLLEAPETRAGKTRKSVCKESALQGQ